MKLAFRHVLRPAARFLYFRFVMAYLQHKVEGTAPWTIDYDCFLNPGWTMPGSFLRRSVFLPMAQKLLGEPLPTKLYETTTFEDPQTQLEDTEDAIVTSLVIGLTEEMRTVVGYPWTIQLENTRRV